MKMNIPSLALLLSTSLLASMANASQIMVFDDASYVDTSATPVYYRESTTVQATLTSFGYGHATFTGDSASAWTSALSGTDVVLIPETERTNSGGSNLVAGGAGSALESFVSGGGSLITFYDRSTALDSIFSNVFGMSFSASSTFGMSITTDGTAAGYTSPLLTTPSATTAWSLADITSAGGTSYYSNGVGSSLFSVGYGSGTIYALGWDWFNAAPLGAQNGGWLSALDITMGLALQGTTVSVPEPSIVVLMGLGLFGLGLSRRKMKK